MKPRRAIHFEDGKVITLDICGEKITDLCGDWVDVQQRVVEASDGKTHFEWVPSEGDPVIQDARTW